MAEQEGANGADEQPAAAADNPPQVGVISQYVKDLSFENPNAPAVYQWQGQPQIDVQFNIGSQVVGPEVHEVVLKIEISAKANEGTAFQSNCSMAACSRLRNIPPEQLQPFLLAEAPRILFPFARRIIADATIDGGFPPLLLDPIDFAGALHAARRAAAGRGRPAARPAR